MLELNSNNLSNLTIRIGHLAISKDSIGTIFIAKGTEIELGHLTLSIKTGTYLLYRANTGMEDLVATEKVEITAFGKPGKIEYRHLILHGLEN